MASYSGTIDTYDLAVQTPNVHTNYKRVIHVKGSFGIGFLCFVPAGGSLGTNGKRPGGNYFDVYFWMEDYAPIADMLRNEKPVYFYYNTSYNTCTLKTGNEIVGEEES